MRETAGADQGLGKEAMLRGLRDVFREYAAKEPKVSKEIGSQIEALKICGNW